MMKNRMAHKGETGSLVTAFGYAMKTRPGPVQRQRYAFKHAIKLQNDHEYTYNNDEH